MEMHPPRPKPSQPRRNPFRKTRVKKRPQSRRSQPKLPEKDPRHLLMRKHLLLSLQSERAQSTSLLPRSQSLPTRTNPLPNRKLRFLPKVLQSLLQNPLQRIKNNKLHLKNLLMKLLPLPKVQLKLLPSSQ